MKKLRSRFASDEISGFLDQGTSVTGELQFSGTLRVDGDFHGSISTKDKLIVGERAQIHADIKVGEIEVYGAIFGNVESARRVQLHSGGSIVGDIRTPELVIEAGGMLDGKSNMAGDDEDEVTSETTRSFRKEWPGR